MTVVLSKNYFMYPKDPTCWVCGDRLYHPPFVQWTVHGSSGGEEMVICVDCCRSLRTGLAADMIHAVAIEDLRALGYRGCTLKLVGQEKVDEAAAEEKSVVCGPWPKSGT
jgi:hypothetical protein